MKKIVSIDIKGTTTDHVEYITESHVNVIIQLLFYCLKLYPPHAQIENSKTPIRIMNLTWLISYKHYKIMQDILNTISLCKEETTHLKKGYYTACVDLLFLILVTTTEESNILSLKNLLKTNKIHRWYFITQIKWILLLKITCYKFIIKFERLGE